MTKPVGSKYSPAVYVTFVGAVLTEMEDRVGDPPLEYVTLIDLQYSATFADVCVIATTIVPLAEPVKEYEVAVEVRDFSLSKAEPPTVTFNFADVPLAPLALTEMLVMVPDMPEVVKFK